MIYFIARPWWLWSYDSCISKLPVLSVPITTNVSSNPRLGEMYSKQHYVIEFVSDLWQVGGFLRVLWFPPPLKLTATIYGNWNIVESGIKYHTKSILLPSAELKVQYIIFSLTVDSVGATIVVTMVFTSMFLLCMILACTRIYNNFSNAYIM